MKMQIDAAEYLEIILKQHSPRVQDIGDQRDPYNVIACTCMDWKDVKKDYSQPNQYSKHLVEILKQKYFSQLYSDMR